jgi:hypothetical protein
VNIQTFPSAVGYKKIWRFEDLHGQKIVSETKKGRKEGRKKESRLCRDRRYSARERERKKEARILLFCFTLLAISLPPLLKVFHVLLQKEDVIISRSKLVCYYIS